MQPPSSHYFYKNVALALILCLFFGPLGLLYSSYWAGVVLTFFLLIVLGSKLLVPLILLWVISCIWAVRSAECHNKNLLKKNQETYAKTNH